MSGALTIGLDAFLWIGIDAGFFTITLFEATFNLFHATLFDFNLECHGVIPPDLVSMANVAPSSVLRTAADPAKGTSNLFPDHDRRCADSQHGEHAFRRSWSRLGR